MRHWIPSLFVLAVSVFLLSGCSGWLKGEPAPEVVRLPAPTPVVVHPFVPGVHRYVSAEDRLSFPTATPVSSPTPRPTPDFSRVAATPVQTLVTPTPEPPVVSWEGETPSCTDQYRSMLIDYRGRIPFGAEVVWSLSEDLKQRRPGCVDEGWDPFFDTGVTCVAGAVAGIGISPGLTRRLNSISHPRALPTGRDGKGNILVHFERLPLADRSGCWYYNSALQAWAWSVPGVDSGVDRLRFPACDRLLRSLVRAVAASDGDFGPVQVARALDEVRRRLPAGCGSLLWNPFPGPGSHEDCGVPGDTGVNGDGFLVITWHPGYLPADGSICWTLDPEAGSWEFFLSREDG